MHGVVFSDRHIFKQQTYADMCISLVCTCMLLTFIIYCFICLLIGAVSTTEVILRLSSLTARRHDNAVRSHDNVIAELFQKHEAFACLFTDEKAATAFLTMACH